MKLKLISMLIFFLSACTPATATAQPTITAAPTSAGQMIAAVTQVWRSTPTPTITPTPTQTPAGGAPTSTLTPVPPTPAPTNTSVWVSPDAVEGEQPDCHRQSDGRTQYPVAHLLGNPEGALGCHLTVTLPKRYQEVVLTRPGTLYSEFRAVFVNGELQNPENIPSGIAFLKVEDGFWVFNTTDQIYDVRFHQADEEGDLQIFPTPPSPKKK